MNIVDIVILTLICLSALVGFWRGLTREVLGISSWVLALVLTYFLKDLPKPVVQQFVSNALFADLVSALVVFVVTLVVLTSITYKFSDAIKGSVVGGADRVLGLFYGILRGFLIVGLLGFGLNKFLLKNPDASPEALKGSRMLKVSDLLVTKLVMSIPPESINQIKKTLESLTNNGSSLTEEDQEEGSNENA